MSSCQFFGRTLGGAGGWPDEEIVNAANAHVGGVVFNQAGQVLLVEPKNHFDGYMWTFPKIRRKPGESPGKTALRALSDKGGVVPVTVGYLDRGYGGTAGGSMSFYSVMVHRDRQDVPTSPHVTNTVWAKPDQARELIKQTTNDAGRVRDLLVFRGALAKLTYLLSIESYDPRTDEPVWPSPHGRDWFRSDYDPGMNDGTPITREKLEQELRISALEFGTEAQRLYRPIRPRPLPPPTRNFTEGDMEQLRFGFGESRGLAFVEPVGENDPERVLRLCLYRSRSGLCAYEAVLRKGPLGWVCKDLIMDETIFGSTFALPEEQGTDAWESLVFEHIVANLGLKNLDEALWRRFFDAGPDLTL